MYLSEDTSLLNLMSGPVKIQRGVLQVQQFHQAWMVDFFGTCPKESTLCAW